MKKTIAIILAAVMVLSLLCGCDPELVKEITEQTAQEIIEDQKAAQAA